MKQVIKVSSFGDVDKTVEIENNILTFNNQSILLSEVREIKYGIEPLRLDMFYVGRKYFIDLSLDLLLGKDKSLHRTVC